MSVIPSRDSEDDHWWKKSKILRTAYHPLLMASDSEYRKWYIQSSRSGKKLSKKIMRQQLIDAQASVAPFSRLAPTFVGYGEVKDEIPSAVEYWIVRDEGFRNLCPMPPPQVFIVKGSSGTGKTSLVHSLMYEATTKGAERNIPYLRSSCRRTRFLTNGLANPRKKSHRFLTKHSSDQQFYSSTRRRLLQGSREIPRALLTAGCKPSAAFRRLFLKKSTRWCTRIGRCILILATNEFGSVIEAVRRRGSFGNNRSRFRN